MPSDSPSHGGRRHFHRGRRGHDRRGGDRRSAPPQNPPPVTAPPAGRGEGRGRPAVFPAQQRPPGDPAVIERGRTLYAVTCSACHGVDLRGGQLGGPNLLRSPVMLNDQHGELIIPVVKNGRQNPGIDSIQEVQVLVNGFKAEYGQASGGVVNVVTRGGTNSVDGTGFFVFRNQDLMSASPYASRTLGKDPLRRIHYGGNIGGPILRNNLFFFVNYEEFRLPQTYGASRVLITDLASSGVYTYRDTTGVVRNINLLTLAGNQNPSLPASVRPYATTLDPTVANLQNLFSQGARSGTIRDRIASASDYIRRDLTFQAPGTNIRRFPTARFDWNITKNNQLEFVYHYQQYFSDPDAVNGQLPVVPGEGIVLGAPEPVTGSIIRNAYSGAIAWRSTISSNLTNEVRGTLGNGGISIFGSEAAPGLFAGRRGYSLVWPSNWSNPQTRSSQSRRHTPIWILYDNVTWVKGEHSFNFGGSFTFIKSFQSSIGTQAIPSVTFGIAAGDPVNTGATSIFTTTNFPNSSAAQRTDAAALYALVTGRISSMAASASLDPDSKQYARGAFIDQNRQKELGFYIQDSWRFRPNLTINYGARWELDFAPRNVNGIYTTRGYESIYGVSGVGNVFRPGLFANNTIPGFGS